VLALPSERLGNTSLATGLSLTLSSMPLSDYVAMTTEFSHFELKHLRKTIGASLPRMAELLGLSGQNAPGTVNKMELGSKPISGPIQRVARFMQEGIEEGSMSQALPPFMICTDLHGEIEMEWVFHTRYPRFLAAVTGQPVDGLICATLDNIEWLSVAMWIDEPVDDSVAYVKEAAAALLLYTEDFCRRHAD